MNEEPTAAGRRQTVLCIDDDRLVLGVCTNVLEARGYRVVMATHGRAGIAIAKKERPDLIILDIMMPGMDGFEVCKQLRADPGLCHTPILIMTAMSLPDLEAKGIEAGATLSIRKPFNPDQVASTVDQVLGRSLPAEHPPL